MNSDLNKSGSSPEQPPLDVWERWLQATGVNRGYGYRVPQEVWDAAWNGNWPDDEETIQWILDEYLDLELAKAGGYLELAVPVRQQGQAALNTIRNKAEQQRQIKIDADIDEVIKTIRGLGLKPDEEPSASNSCGEKPSRRRNRWMRLAVTNITTFVVGVLAGFVGGYNLPAAKHPADIAVARSPEIRRAIPVEPEIRKAIPVEIRKAIPVYTVRNSATRYATANSPHVEPSLLSLPAIIFLAPGRFMAKIAANRPRASSGGLKGPRQPVILLPGL